MRGCGQRQAGELAHGWGMRIDRIANQLGRDSRGLVRRPELVAGGVGTETISARLRSGMWTRTEASGSVIDLQTHPDDWHKAVLAAVLGGPTDTLASHRTAGFLHGLLDVQQPATIDVTTPRSVRNHAIDVRQHSTLSPDAGTVVDGIPVTGWPRTVRDLVPVLHPIHVHRIVARCLRRRRDAARRLVAELEACSRTTAGVGRFRRVLEAELRSDRTLLESPLEDVCHRALDHEGLAPESVQYEVRELDRVLARLDFAWPSVRHAWQVDGKDFHTAAPDRDHDGGQDAALLRLGWTVERVCAADLCGAARAATFADLRTRLAGTGLAPTESCP